MRFLAFSIALLLAACAPSRDSSEKRAAELFDQENYQEAKLLLDSMIAKGSNDGQLHYMRASCHFNLKNYPAAIDDYRAAIANGFEKDAETFFYLGSSSFYLADFESAIQNLTMAVTLKPDYAQAFSMRGDTWMASGQPDSAVLDFNRSVQLSPKSAGTHFSLGNYFVSISNYDQALLSFSQAIELEPKSEYLYNRGLIYYHENEFENAINDLTYALTLDDSNVEALVVRGNIKDELGNSPEALLDFDAAIALNPENGFAYFNRGITRKNSGDTKGACEDFNKALSLGYTEAIAKTGDCVN